MSPFLIGENMTSPPLLADLPVEELAALLLASGQEIPRIGSLFSGYGGLDLGVEQALAAETVWHVEYDDAPSRILAHNFPGIPNYGDVTSVDWSTVAPVDILTGGFPCQDVSLVGRRRGMKEGTRSGLWSEFARAIDELRPGLVVIENVRGLLSAEATGIVESDPWDLGDRDSRPTLRALGAVLGDLADLGFDAEWGGVRAADAGAPHGRYRIFVVAYPRRGRDGRGPVASGHGPGAGADPSPDGAGPRARRSSPADARGETRDLGTGLRPRRPAGVGRGRSHGDGVPADPFEWGQHAASLARWERVVGRPAPHPVARTERGSYKLSPRFSEWMMGVPDGWITSHEIGLSFEEQHRAIGNGVVPQQADLAVRALLGRIGATLAGEGAFR